MSCVRDCRTGGAKMVNMSPGDICRSVLDLRVREMSKCLRKDIHEEDL